MLDGFYWLSGAVSLYLYRQAMAKIRGVKPEYWTDIDILELSLEARLFYIGLWNFVDDNGVFEWSPKQLKVLIFPCDNVDIDKCLKQLLKKQVGKFKHEEKEYGIIWSFGKHQKIDNRYRKEILPTTVLPRRVPAVPTESPATDGVGVGDGVYDSVGDIDNNNKLLQSSINDLDDISCVPDEDKKPQQYGNQEINDMLNRIKKEVSRDEFKDSQKYQRIYGKHLCNLEKKIGNSEFVKRLKDITSDNFKLKNCGSLKYIYGEIKSAQTQSKKKTVSINF